jgi:hypothetical protein
MQGELTSPKFLSVVIALTIMSFAGVALGQSSNGPSVQIKPDNQVEKDKLAAPQYATYLTLGTIVVTALVGFGTIAYNVRNAKSQAELQARLKALEIVISAAGPNTAKERLKIVKELLGEKFIEPSVGKNMIAQGVGPGHDQNRKDLMKMLLEYPDRRREVFSLWGVAFGDSNLELDITAMAKVLNMGTEGEDTDSGNAEAGGEKRS